MLTMKVKKNLHFHSGMMDLEVNIDFPKHQCTALCGPSGAGKTTILRMIAGLTKPDCGTIKSDSQIFFDSERKVDLPVQKRKIGFVFQDYALFPHMNVVQNLQFAMPLKDDSSLLDEMLEVNELQNLRNKYPHQISGGQKQRVALARALVQKPQILLLDEPLSALDPAMRRKLQDHLQDINNRFKITTVLVSHDVGEITKLANVIIKIQNGHAIDVKSRS